MTKRKERVPREEGKFNLWLLNFNNNFPSVADAVGESASVARIAQDAVACGYLILRNEAVRAYQKEESKVKDRAINGKVNDAAPVLPVLNLPPEPAHIVLNSGIWDNANKLVQRIIKSNGFTPEIEALLDIALRDDGDDLSPDEMKPVIKEISAIIDAVKIKASLQEMKSYRVFCRRGTSDIFETVGDSSQTEFFDERPNTVAGQPETRNYKLIFLESNKPVGNYSAVETVVTKP